MLFIDSDMRTLERVEVMHRSLKTIMRIQLAKPYVRSSHVVERPIAFPCPLFLDASLSLMDDSNGLT